ncbi:MAG TPA: redox-sensing transcriptional repressor Rex [Anaerolineales bacterium]|nr:redox-sensing transcriptional repressor Rex [Anaerolineales bacterium]
MFYGTFETIIEPTEKNEMTQKPIPDIVIGRLPIYLRALTRMLQAGRQVTSSQELGERLGMSAAQIRKDLSQFGEFGKQGTGYNIEFLAKKLQEILKIDRVWKVAVVGAGDVGHALANYNGFAHRGFQITHIFDNDSKIVGSNFNGFTVQSISDMQKIIQKEEIKVAMLAVPAEVAQDVVDLLVECGVHAILNYAPVNLTVPQDVRVQYIDPAVHLQNMTYYLD